MTRSSLPLARLLLATSLAIPAGCGALDEFEETITDSTTIRGADPVMRPFTPAYAGNFSGLQLSNSKTFQNNDVSPSDVDAIFVKKVTLTMDAGDGSPAELNRLDRLLSEVHYWVEAPGLDRTIFAEATSFPEGPTVDLMVTPNFNLKPYATASSMNIGADVTLAMMPFVNVKLETAITLLIDVNLF